jgi:hypothetical protein
MVVASQNTFRRILLSLTLLPPSCLLRTALRKFDLPTQCCLHSRTPCLLTSLCQYGNRPFCLSPGTNLDGATTFPQARFVLIDSLSWNSWVTTCGASTCFDSRHICLLHGYQKVGGTHYRTHLKTCGVFLRSYDLAWRSLTLSPSRPNYLLYGYQKVKQRATNHSEPFATAFHGWNVDEW